MLVQLATAAQARGFRQHVVSLTGRGRYAGDLEAHDIGVTAIDVTSFTGAIKGLLRLAGIIRRFSPKIVQGWMYHGNIFAVIADRLAPRAAPCALFWNLRASNMDEKRYGRVLRWGARLSAWPDIVIANSESGAAFHRAAGYKARRMVVIENGIDTEKFCPDEVARVQVRQELGIPPDAQLVMHVARVDLMKDHATFLKAIAKVPSVTALMVGKNTDQLATPQNVKTLGLRQEMARLYAAADIVVSSSAFGEGFSNAIAEGMSAGLVPIATDVGDARRIIGDTGHIVPPGDADALAATIAQECQSTNRVVKGLRARARIVENFSLAQAVEAYTRLYEAI
jgi:glycosyltransferase involved in cell wall biosynthesis